MSRLNDSATHTKCKASASLMPMNLSSSGMHMAYLHRNEIHLVKESSLGTARGVVGIIPCADKATSSALIQASVGGSKVLILGTRDGTIHFFDEKSMKVICQGKTGVEGPKARITSIATTEKVIYCGSACGNVFAFKFDGKELSAPKAMSGHKCAVMAMASSGPIVISGDESGAVSFWVDTKLVATSKGKGHPCLCLTAGHGYAVAGFSTGHIRMYNLAKKRLHTEISAHNRAVTAVATHPDDPLIATASEDSFVSAWHLPTAASDGVKCVVNISPGTAAMTGVTFCSGGKEIAAIAYDSRYISTLPVPGCK